MMLTLNRAGNVGEGGRTAIVGRKENRMAGKGR